MEKVENSVPVDPRKRIRARFGSHKVLYGKVHQGVPENADREYLRIMHWYMRQVKAVLQEELPSFKDEYRKELGIQQAQRTDGVFDFRAFTVRFINQMLEKLDSFGMFQKLIKRLRKLGIITRDAEIQEWKNQVRRTIGLDIKEDFYKGEFFEEMLEEWVKANVDLIRTIPHDMLGKMQEIILDGYNNGRRSKDIVKDIMQEYDVSKRHAELIARDQMSKLNAQITRAQHESIGIHKYRWSDSDDERVRPGHHILDGRIFSYDDPPEIMEWRENKKTGGYWVSTGRFCNPGEDYQCRCVAEIVFEEDELDTSNFGPLEV